MDIKYVYFIGSLLFLIIWIIFFLLRKDLRKEMLIISIPGSILQYLGCKYWCTLDWWNPYTLTGRGVGIEDFIFGFASFGIAAVIYDVVLHKKYSQHTWKKTRLYVSIYIILLTATALTFIFFFQKTPSFVWYFSATTLCSLVLWIGHRQLFLNSILSGVLFMIISIPIYWFLNYLNPTWIDQTYLFETLTGKLILTIPIEEYLYYITTGMLIGPLFEYCKRRD